MSIRDEVIDGSTVLTKWKTNDVPRQLKYVGMAGQMSNLDVYYGPWVSLELTNTIIPAIRNGYTVLVTPNDPSNNSTGYITPITSTSSVCNVNSEYVYLNAEWFPKHLISSDINLFEYCKIYDIYDIEQNYTKKFTYPNVSAGDIRNDDNVIIGKLSRNRADSNANSQYTLAQNSTQHIVLSVTDALDPYVKNRYELLTFTISFVYNSLNKIKFSIYGYTGMNTYQAINTNHNCYKIGDYTLNSSDPAKPAKYFSNWSIFQTQCQLLPSTRYISICLTYTINGKLVTVDSPQLIISCPKLQMSPQMTTFELVLTCENFQSIFKKAGISTAGEPGKNGASITNVTASAFTPVVSQDYTNTSVNLTTTITDAAGKTTNKTSTFVVKAKNGKDGKDGQTIYKYTLINGVKGPDGYKFVAEILWDKNNDNGGRACSMLVTFKRYFNPNCQPQTYLVHLIQYDKNADCRINGTIISQPNYTYDPNDIQFNVGIQYDKKNKKIYICMPVRLYGETSICIILNNDFTFYDDHSRDNFALSYTYFDKKLYTDQYNSQSNETYYKLRKFTFPLAQVDNNNYMTIDTSNVSLSNNNNKTTVNFKDSLELTTQSSLLDIKNKQVHITLTDLNASDAGGIYITNGSGGWKSLMLCSSINVSFGVPAYATAFYESSDKSLKNYISNISLPDEFIDTFNPIYFSWKSDPTNNQDLGVYALDIQKYYPEIVTDNDTLSLDYSKLSVIALAYIQKYKKQYADEIESLKTEIKNLKKKLNNH